MTENIKDIDFKNLSVEDFMEMKKKFDEAENDTTPYAVVPDDEIKVVGDVNKTEPNKHDYIIRFLFRNSPQNKEYFKGEKIVGETENYLAIEREYHDAWIPPRKHTEVMATLLQLYKFYHSVTENGEIRDMTPDETLVALRTMNEDMIDAMNDVIGVVLNIPEEEREFITVSSAIAASIKMADDFPEVVNGVDFTIGNSLEIK